VIVFSLLIPVLMLRSFLTAHADEEEEGDRHVSGADRRRGARDRRRRSRYALAPAVTGTFTVSLLNDTGIPARWSHSRPPML
jgi:hypothetical protein